MKAHFSRNFKELEIEILEHYPGFSAWVEQVQPSRWKTLLGWKY